MEVIVKNKETSERFEDGKLAACGTINDISVMDAQPVALASAVILEEGFLIEDLEKIIGSMDASCREVGISVVTGDTKDLLILHHIAGAHNNTTTHWVLRRRHKLIQCSL